MRITRLATAAAGVVLMAGLTACGGGDAKDGAKDHAKDGAKASDRASGGDSAAGQGALTALQSVSKKAGQQRSAKVDGTMSMGEMHVSMKGDMDWSDGIRANMTMTQKGGAADAAPTAGKPMRARYLPEAMYMNLGSSLGPKAQGKSWVKYSYDAMAAQAGASGTFLKDQLKNNDPSRSVDLLIASGKVKEVGKEDVRGKQATHYTGKVSVSEIAGLQSKSLSKKDLDALQKQLQQSGMDTETVDLWVDGDHLLVKRQERAQGKKFSTDTTVFYSDYGTKVSVAPPAASETVDFAELMPKR
ncbi:LolA-like protein [Streptomyces varsoviensis]|uniref:Lipoprotein n=1 Tax=Streptomyces varsoviensis TaxID=67373 RepID=A0ABR5JCJ0_9ACTN|nr:hypothetical protein [Streptomyces varsoviensis]KOG91158.1 lipoprotein [Streptomyces varsoviensis]